MADQSADLKAVINQHGRSARFVAISLPNFDRFGGRTYIPLPDAETRARLLQLYVGAAVELDGEALRNLVGKTEGCVRSMQA